MEFTAFSSPEQGAQSLRADLVQLWRVELAQDDRTIERMVELLSTDELARADRFHFPHLRKHFIAARSALRLLIGSLTGASNEEIKFGYTKKDKPYLADGDLRFNVSHAGELALIGFSHNREIGVDIEHIRITVDEEQIARRFFSRAEVEDYLSLPKADRSQAFYNCWTRKEAYVKALGDGITFPLDQFRVSLKPGEPAQLLEVRSNPMETERWKMIAIDPGEGYTGALIAEGRDWDLEGWQFEFPVE